jgi:hypothetical protein
VRRCVRVWTLLDAQAVRGTDLSGTDVLSARLPASHGVIDTSLETRAMVLVLFR